ncbi:MAG: hypothetical protein Q3993_04705, partial [Filifactor alocis]|nr:hypothetical protein [Filifactor alocis]
MVKYVVQVVAFGCLSTYLLFSAIIVAIAANDFGAFEWGFVAIFVGVPAFLDVKLYKALKRTQRERRRSHQRDPVRVEPVAQPQGDFNVYHISRDDFDGINNEFERLNNENDIRILQESIDIMKSTMNIDTFFGRH